MKMHMNFTRLALALVWLMMAGLQGNAQFAPAAGLEGSSAIAADSSLVIGWADSCLVERGLMDVSQPSLGNASYGADINATGMADNVVVSLGDGGKATFYFATPLENHPGPDFAVFENSFSDFFLELCFVEISSDGVNFFRFPAVSLTPEDVQIQSFGTIDPALIDNLGGKYRGGFGTPFDFGVMVGTNSLDINQISHIRLVDVVGSVDEQYATTDSEGHLVNDPWPTAFESSGFDLDGLALLAEFNAVNAPDQLQFRLFPQPAGDYLFAELPEELKGEIYLTRIVNSMGSESSVSYTQPAGNQLRFDLAGLPAGLYFLQIQSSKSLIRTSFLVR